MANERRKLRVRLLTRTHDAPPRGPSVRVGGLAEPGALPTPLLFTALFTCRSSAPTACTSRSLQYKVPFPSSNGDAAVNDSARPKGTVQ